MAQALTMRHLSHRAPFTSCVVFPPVTLKFPCGCFDNKEIIRQVFIYWPGKARKALQLDTLLLVPNAHG